MNRLIWIAPLCLATGLCLGFLAGAFTAPVTVTLQETAASQPMPADAVVPPPVQEQAVMQPEDKETFDTRWSAAPGAITALARIIADGGTPTPAELDSIGATALSQGYPAPRLDFTRDDRPVPYMATLLQEAAMAYNAPAALALIAQGADPRENHSEVLFMAIERTTPGAPAFMLFPDHDASLPVLRALLQGGADPNAARHGFRHETPLSLAEGQRNLGALLMLLEFGADPWRQPKFPDGTPTDSLMESLGYGVANLATTETLFRLLRDGKVQPGAPEQTDRLFTLLDQAIDNFATGSGPETRHTAWRFDQLLQVAGPRLSRTEEASRLRSQLAAFDFQIDGGWYLAQDEVHSRYDAPLSTPDRGDQIWGP
ncbi:MAG: hypothetical protein RLZZ437_2226 [Pseudomonadota bacterium]|jgi:hypothetical protein